jgi:N-methylhydantoinase B
MAEVGEGSGLAEAAALHAPGGAVISGKDPRRNDSPFVNQIFLGLTGGPGSPVADGWLTFHTTGAAGMCYRDSVELDELRYPFRVLEQRIIPDTEGAGRFRGAPSALVEFGPVDCSLELVYAHDGTINAAAGARGAQPGGPGAQLVRAPSGEVRPADPCTRLVLAPGETVLAVSGGGGGYGHPASREPERVREDVVEGVITRARAEEVYLVVVDDAGDLDEEATARLRAAARDEDAKAEY